MSDYPEPHTTQLAVSDLSPRTEVSVWPDGRVEIDVTPGQPIYTDITIMTSRDALLAALGGLERHTRLHYQAVDPVDGGIAMSISDRELWPADAEARVRAWCDQNPGWDLRVAQQTWWSTNPVWTDCDGVGTPIEPDARDLDDSGVILHGDLMEILRGTIERAREDRRRRQDEIEDQ